MESINMDDYSFNEEGPYNVNITLMLAKDNPLDLDYHASKDFYDVPRYSVMYLFNKVLELKGLMERLFGVNLSVEVKEKDHEVYIEIAG